MKNKILLCLALSALVLAGCGGTNNSTNSSSNVVGSTTSSSSKVSSPKVESSSTTSSAVISSTTSSTTPTPGPTINHIDPFVKVIEEASTIRNFNGDYDTMLEDFSGDTLNGTTENGVAVDNHLRVLVDSLDEGFPNSPDAAIYKMATGSYQIQSYEGIGFRMRKVGEGTLDYSNLVLALRGADAYKTYDLALSDALNPDAEALPELTAEYQDIVIAPGQSLEDDTTEYELPSGELSGVKVLETILGFHLYAKGDCAQVIEIEEVFLMNAGEKTVLDSFNRTAVNATDETVWWRDSTGFIVRNGINLNEGASYTISSEELANHENLALTVLGDTTGASVTPITATGEGTAINWADLKDNNNVAVSNAVNGAYHSLVINFANSGIDAATLTGVKIASTTDMDIAQVFVTNLKEKEALTNYPHLDTANAVVFDSFTRTQTKIDDNYDASAANQVVIDAGLYHSISYEGSNLLSVDGDALVFQPSSNYTQLDEASQNARTTQKYMVFSMKLGEGTTLNNFRISDNVVTVYANEWYAGAGLKSIPENLDAYPYVDADGYVYYIIDLEETGLNISNRVIIYYTGEGTLMIDSIFFANEYKNEKLVSLVEEDASVSFTTAGDGYGYMYGGYNPGADKLYFTVKGDGNAALESFRLQYNGKTIHVNAGLKIYNSDGTVYDYNTVLPTEETTLYVDLAESGFDLGVADDVHLHFGQDENGTSGTITFTDRGYVYDAGFERATGEPGSVSFTNADDGYGYLYGGYIQGTCTMYKMVVKGDGNAALESFRLQYNGKTIYANAGLVIYNADGTAYDYTQPLPTEETTLYIDLAESGFDLGVAEHVHLHFGQDKNGTSGTITFVAMAEFDDTIPYAEVISQYVEYVAPSTEE